MIGPTNRMKELFLAAANLERGERSTFLKTACDQNPDLQAAVERLLAAHDRPHSLLDREAVAPPLAPGRSASPRRARPCSPHTAKPLFSQTSTRPPCWWRSTRTDRSPR